MDWKWIIYCALGELLGFTAAALLNLVHLQWIGEPTTITTAVVVLILATLGGVAEGSILAWFQWMRLRHYLPQLDLVSWRNYTAAIAAIGWFLGMLVPTYLTLTGAMPTDQSEPVVEPPIWAIALLGMVMGIGLGILFGYFQSIPLRSVIHNPRIWIWANVLAWSAAMVILMVGPSIIPAGTPLGVIIAIAMVSGLLAGLCIGAITLIFIPKMDRIKQ